MCFLKSTNPLKNLSALISFPPPHNKSRRRIFPTYATHKKQAFEKKYLFTDNVFHICPFTHHTRLLHTINSTFLPANRQAV